MSKIIFFQAHPDDLEHKCGHIMHHLCIRSKKKYNIRIASMTKGEFGLPGPQYDRFKGDLLARIRMQELFNAEQIHGISPENIDFFDYIDGYVPFNNDIINRTIEYLNKERPDIIFAPEAIYTWYYHMDHVNTGRVIFHIIYKKLIDFTPKLYFYTSLSPNYFFGFKKEDLALTYKLITCHKTQRWLLNWTMLPYRFTSRFAGRKLRGWKYAEPYRRIYFNKRNLKKNGVSFFVKIFTHFYSSLPWFKAKYPQDVLDKIREKRI